jgi:uncharacterized BrkB/YihY/UPF0761 family membrane protein
MPAPLGPAARRRKLGTYLMLFFMVGWIVSMIGMQMTIGVKKGFGTGFGDGGRVPPDIVQMVGVGDKAADVVAATSHNVGDMPIGEQVLRIAFSFAVLLAIIFFWYSIISRVGTF